MEAFLVLRSTLQRSRCSGVLHSLMSIKKFDVINTMVRAKEVFFSDMSRITYDLFDIVR